MIKSLAITSIVCALNMGGSFNIQPKEVQWDDTRNISKSAISYESLNYNQGDDFTYYNKNIYRYEDNYVTIETTELTIYSWSLDRANDGWTEMAVTTFIWNYYKGFALTCDLYNTYSNFQISNSFTDNKGTGYTWNYSSPSITREYSYIATAGTKAALQDINNTTQGGQMGSKIMAFATAFNSVTKTALSGSVNADVNGNLNYQQGDIDQHEDYELWTYDTIYEQHIPITITYLGEVIQTTDQYDAWLNQFYEIVEGQQQFVINFKTTNNTYNQNQIYIVVDTGGATSPEVIDIGGIMWDIIGMPFTFINQAFNVTLFPGTIYQFNIGNLFKGLIAILAILFVVKLFTRGIDVLGAYSGSARDTRFKKEDQQMKREQHQMLKEKHEKDMNKKE